MRREKIEFKLTPGVNLRDAEMTLRLAVLGAAGLHGESEVRLRSRCRLARGRRAILVEGAAEVVASIVKLLIAFLSREFGEGQFRVHSRRSTVPVL